ncbi:hypothetical protein M569_08390 [Genlisea aurea]|uniref:RAVE complex protein Rav1 C-terminal domain-containing protein n=1 Tax=Genlisea aurea TaxID=192259 RepID=S8DTB7_9LAMI|nr:hypothetical protein M569_08390 [Genlisea aurea]
MEGSSSDSPIPRLPLQLIQSQIIPPAPSRSRCGSEPIADFLLEFSGLSWIAYGASSAVVIAHFPNPMSEPETKLGPVYRQVIELSRDGESQVSAVSWSPARPSLGELAVALSGFIFLLKYGEDKTSSTILEQSTKAEAIRWTGSGDGIISGGIEVVLWSRRESWEKSWSFKPEVPQALVSACWFANGLLATAPLESKLPLDGSNSATSNAKKSVLIFEGNGHSKYPKAILEHPMPVSFMQWRPFSGKTSSRHAGRTRRPVLLTCCIDGAARLWGEVENGTSQNTGNANAGHKSARPSFFVVAVIDLSQALNGYLGSELLLRWGIEVEGAIFNAGEARYHSVLDHSPEDTAGACEWIIGVGPKGVAILWAMHCLDDLASLRFPRITLWKKLNLLSFEVEAGLLASELYSLASGSLEGKSTFSCSKETALTARASGVLDCDGHTGKIFEAFPCQHPFGKCVEKLMFLIGLRSTSA